MILTEETLTLIVAGIALALILAGWRRTAYGLLAVSALVLMLIFSTPPT